MKRRDFIKAAAGSVAGWPLAAQAQQAAGMRRVGVLMGTAEKDSDTLSRLAALRQGLARRGWSEGRNVHLDYRFAGGQLEKAPVLAKELVALQPDVILSHSTGATAAFKREGGAIPVVFVNVSDPIGSGFIASVARPGGNLTGVQHFEAGIVGKWLAMLKEIAPNLKRVALLANRNNIPFDYFLHAAQTFAPALAVELVPSHVSSETEIRQTVEALARVPDCGMALPPDAIALTHRDLVVALAAQHRLPAVYAFRLFVEAGGLMSYGTDQNEMFRLAASYVDRILRGDKPSDLPVQAPAKFETTVNLKTAKALGLTVPPGLLVAADEVFE
jgi:putative ABC transport system substrate-binding protein